MNTMEQAVSDCLRNYNGPNACGSAQEAIIQNASNQATIGELSQVLSAADPCTKKQAQNFLTENHRPADPHSLAVEIWRGQARSETFRAICNQIAAGWRA